MAETSMTLIELADKNRDTVFLWDLGQYAPEADGIWGISEGWRWILNTWTKRPSCVGGKWN